MIWSILRHPLKSKRYVIASCVFYLKKEAQCLIRPFPVLEAAYSVYGNARKASAAGPGLLLGLYDLVNSMILELCVE